MFQRQVPDRERFELGIAGLYSPLVLLVELGQADSHLAASRARCCHRHERTGGRHIVVTAKSVFGVDESHIVRVALDRMVVIGRYAPAFELGTIIIGTGLAIIVGDDHRAY